MEIFIAKSGCETGPFTEDQIRPMLESGMLGLTDSVWHKGMAEWTTVHQFLGLRPPVPGVPPQKPIENETATRVIEPVNRSGELAPFARRLGSLLIDSVVWIIMTSLMARILMNLLFGDGIIYTSVRETDRIFWIAGVVLGWLYSAVMESSSCRATLGKMAFGLVVTHPDGSPLSFRQASRRYSAKWLVPATMGISFLPCAWTFRKQALHDIIAGSIVVRK